MSEQKRIVIAIYCLVLLAVCTYVPWEAGAANSSLRIPAGYTFIWDAPTYYAWNPSTVKTIGEPVSELDEILGLGNNKTGNSHYDSFMASTTTNKLPIAGIDMKRLGVEILGATAIFGIALLLIDRKENNDFRNPQL